MTELVRTKSAANSQELEQLLLSMYSLANNGLTVTPSGALKVPEVLGCINVLAQSMSMLPLNIYERTDSGRTKLKTDPVYKVMGQKPNEYQSPLEFKRMMTFNCAWQGNSYAKKVMLRGKLIYLWPLPNASVEPKLQDDWSIKYKIHPDPNNKHVYETLDQSEVLHLRGPICPKGWISESPVEICKNAIATMIAIDNFSGKYFNGGAKAKGAFRLPTMDALGDEAFERLKATLNESANSDVIPLLEQGLEWVKMDYSARDSLLGELQDAQVNKICRVWRIQPHMIQSLKNATFSNIEHQSREFVDHTLMPWIGLWESAMKMQLMDPYNDDIYPKISAQALLRGDNATRASVYQTATQSPYMTPNEARALEDMDDIEGGDELLRPLNMGSAKDQNDEPETEE